MKTDNIEESQETNTPISKGLSAAGSPVGNNEDRPLARQRLLGKFHIDDYYLREAPDQVAFLLASLKFVPYRVEFLAASQVFEYIGCSPLFDEISPGVIPLEYKIVIIRDKEDQLVNAIPIVIDPYELTEPMGSGEDWKQYSVPETGVKCDKCGKQTDEVNLVGHCGECVNAKFNYG